MHDMTVILRHFLVALAFASVMTAPAVAQEAPAIPPPLRDFSLQPKPVPEAPSKAQGPVADGQKPRDTLAPPPPAASPQANVSPKTDVPVRGAPPAPRPNTSQTVQPLPSARPKQSAPARAVPVTQAGSGEQVNEIAPPAARSSAADTGDGAPLQTGQQGVQTGETTLPETVPSAVSQNSSASSANPDSGWTGSTWALIAAVFAALGMLAYYLLRRRNAPGYTQSSRATADMPQEDRPQPSPPLHPGRSVNPAPAPTPPVPAPPAGNGGGFVTSSLKLAPRRPVAPPPAPQSAPARVVAPLRDTANVRLEFAAESAGSTLFNAVLGYRITLYNDGTETLGAVRLAGCLAQASGDGAPLPIDHMQPLGDTNSLAPGASATFKGEIRLPLAQIEPISYNRQALFVPVAHFACLYVGVQGRAHEQRHSFIVGREHEPPRDKLAPFRLDQGPRNFRPVGQRALAV